MACWKKAINVITDARTEWSIRWTALTIVSYALLFYNTNSSKYFDWTLLVQLVQGGNLAFYNYGWHYWFGLMACVGLVIGGCFVSIIYEPFLRQTTEDNASMTVNSNGGLWQGYIVMMAIISVSIIPCSIHLGVLSSLNGIALLIIVIFVENIYVPVLNLRTLLPNAHSIWLEVIQPSVYAALVYVCLSWALYLIPPWHSGSTQALRIVYNASYGVSSALRSAARLITPLSSLDCGANSDEEKQESENEVDVKESKQLQLQDIGSILFAGTNEAGLATAIDLYASMGSYELNFLYPISSLDVRSAKLLSKRLDETLFHCSVVLWLLGIIPSSLSDDENLSIGCNDNNDVNLEVHNALVQHLNASSNLISAIGTFLQVERRYLTPKGTNKNDFRERIVLNSVLWDWNDSDVAYDGNVALDKFQKAKIESLEAVNNLKTVIDNSNGKNNDVDNLILWSLVKDFSYGSRPISHFMSDDDLLKYNQSELGGTLGRLCDETLHLQTSWNKQPLAIVRLFMRMTMIHQGFELLTSWISGVRNMYMYMTNTQKGVSKKAMRNPLLQRRTIRRSIQWLVGTLGLYAMVTWWEEFRSWLGSSSTGPWTMVAFYVCFRPTVEETIQTSLLRSIGHSVGAFLAWIVNNYATSSSYRIFVHTVVTLVLTWFIPPPFVFPSSIKISWIDTTVGNGMIEGILTTYHLVSSIVLNTDVRSAAKARAASQCIGSLAASIVSICVLPWWAESSAQKSLDRFKHEVSISLNEIGKIVVEKRIPPAFNNKSKDTNSDDMLGVQKQRLRQAVDDLLACRSALSSVLESPCWIRYLLSPFGKANASLAKKLVSAILVGVALESTMEKLKSLKDFQLPDGHENLDLNEMLCKDSIMTTINAVKEENCEGNVEDKEKQCDTLVTLYILMTTMKQVGFLSQPKSNDELSDKR